MAILDEIRSHVGTLFREREREMSASMLTCTQQYASRSNMGGSAEVYSLSQIAQATFTAFQKDILECIERNLRSASAVATAPALAQVHELARELIREYKGRIEGVLQYRIKSDAQRSHLNPLHDATDLHLHELRVRIGAVQKAVEWERVVASGLLALGAARADESKFTPSELAGISSLLERLIAMVQEQHQYVQGHLDAQDQRLSELNNRVRHLIASASTMNRKDWIALAFGTLTNLIPSHP